MNFVNIIKERKIIDGMLYRRYFVDSEGIEIGIMSGISTTTAYDNHYVVSKLPAKKYPSFQGRCFSYFDKNSQEQAFKEAIAATKLQLEAMPKLTEGVRSLPSIRKTRIKKVNAFLGEILPSGIAIHHQASGRYVLNVSVFDHNKNKFVNVSMHCGNETTVQSRFHEILDKAIKLRKESLVAYNKLTTGK